MAHLRGQIVESTDFCTNKPFFKVFTGCEWLDDFYTCDDYQTALNISNELKQRGVNHE
jgi:hypothetical protein